MRKEFYTVVLSTVMLTGCSNVVETTPQDETAKSAEPVAIDSSTLPSTADAIPLVSAGEYEFNSTLDALLSGQMAKTHGASLEDEIEAYRSVLNAREGMLEAPQAIVAPRAATGNRVSGIRVVDGVRTVAFPTAGAVLKGTTKSDASLQCTGTLITCSSFLTAAHCLGETQIDPFTGEEIEVQNTNPNNYFVFLQNSGVHTVTEVKYIENEYNFPDADVALLTLSSEPTGAFSSPINDVSAVGNGAEGDIVGFGRTGGFNFDYGIKRTGKIRTDDCPNDLDQDNFVCWKFNRTPSAPIGSNSNTCNGDSGGPLFISAGGVNSASVAGVTSGGEQRNCLSGDRSYNASVFNYQNWIKANVVGDLGLNLCGASPHLGDPEVRVLASEGELNSVVSELLFDFPINATATRFSIVMNGESGSGNVPNDFDLLVKAGTIPTSSDADCVLNEKSQFMSCSLQNPQAGKWYALVRRKTGGGRFQLVVTEYN